MIMRELSRGQRIWPVLLGASHLLCAAEFSAQFVDGLKRPLPGVMVEVACENRRDEPPREVKLLHLRSDSNGLVHDEYDAVSAGCGEFLDVSVEKEGYASFSSGLRSRYVLERRFAADEVHRVAALEGETRQQAVKCQDILYTHYQDILYTQGSGVSPS
jgi:hypothetical protein